MSWFSTRESFPAAVKNAQLPAGTCVQEHYVIENAVRVCAAELTYRAEDTRTNTQVCLHEFLPMRWCMRDENNIWQPYQAEDETTFTAAKNACLARLEQLQPLREEAALRPITDVFEAYGTIWAVTESAEELTLADELALRLFTPQEAITLLAPVMDTLAGLHEISVYHGGINAHSVLLHEDTAVLTGWCSAVSEENSASADVKAISTLLYRMMTGEQVYQKETAAALPSGIRKALRMGMEDPDVTMDMLWKKLHADRPSRRTVRMQRKDGTSKLGKVFSPAFTVIFCVLCLAALLGTGAAISFSGRLQESEYALSQDEICVPELLYLTQEDAVKMAEDLGLHVIIAAREDNPVVEADHIVTQKPNAGAVLKTGDTVQLVVSDGWSNYVPDVCNMLKEDAVAVLEELGFVVKCTEIFSAGDAPNTVISQSVKADTDLERDSVIRLKISLGREDVDTSKFEEVGNFVGMEFEEAKLLLSELHLYAFQAEAVYDPEVPKGVVISQAIEEGMKVPQGTVINMVVSLGVETVRVPQVTLMNVNAAKALLESMRLKAVMMYVANSSYATDSVISQATPAGKLVPVDSEIWLTVSTGTQNTIISTGGWSGAPLPTFETTETTTSETSVSETMTTQTDVTVTTTTQESGTETADSTPPETTDSTKAMETSATTKTPETQQTVQTTAEPQPTDPPATDPPATTVPETQAPQEEDSES